MRVFFLILVLIQGLRAEGEKGHFYGPAGAFKDVGKVRQSDGTTKSGAKSSVLQARVKPVVLKVYKYDPSSIKMVVIDKALEKQFGNRIKFHQMQVHSEYDDAINSDIVNEIDVLRDIKALAGAVPTPMYLFFNDGKLLHTHQGYFDGDEFREVCRAILKALGGKVLEIDGLKKPHSAGVSQKW